MFFFLISQTNGARKKNVTAQNYYDWQLTRENWSRLDSVKIVFVSFLCVCVNLVNRLVVRETTKLCKCFASPERMSHSNSIW